jgi:RNA polymerase sigma factor (sigma-70 family)
VDHDPPVDAHRAPAEDARSRALGRRTRPDVRAPGAVHDATRDIDAEFAQFYGEYGSTLLAYVLYLVEHREMAADIVQNTMIEALLQWEKIQFPKTWCRTVARRKCHHQLFSAEDTFDEMPANASPLLDERQPWSVEGEDHILSLVSRLSLTQRDVMALNLAGLSVSEIAEEIGKTTEQVSGNLTAARRALKRLEGRDREREHRHD